MSVFPPTLILRHRKENLKKCSLRGLEERSDFLFFTYPKDPLPPLSEYILLTLDAPPLSITDCGYGLLLIDATWNYAAIMERQLEQPHLFQKRSLPPSLVTAYPRRQTGCLDPTRGLASIEALFAAYQLLGRETAGLLDHYPWKEQFFNLNLCIDFSPLSP
jgi:pre-rRNA-processing protein TSR3